MRALVIGALGLALVAPGCRPPRKPLHRTGDAGSSVELVERPPVGVVPGAGPGDGPLIDEHEPDDDRDHAQPMEPGKGVLGSLEPPTSGGAGRGDDDWYSYLVQQAPGETQTDRVQELGIEVSGAADLALEVYDGDGHRIAAVDERGAGQGESLQGLTVELGRTIYLRVRRGGKGASRGDAGGKYRLRLSQRPAPAGSESEPNDTPEQATQATTDELSGLLWSRKDEDWFVVAVGGGPNGGDGGGAGEGTILRVELQSPGVAPELRLEAQGSGSRQRLLTVKGTGEELRLRNVGLPTGTQRVYIGVRALSWKAAAAQTRYQLRVSAEPPLDGAEREPNDKEPQTLAVGRRGGPTQGEVAGFLWPGDVDLFRVQVDGPSSVTWQMQGAVSGSGCDAALEPVGGAPGGGTGQVVVRTGTESVVRVTGQGKSGRTCFDAPYRLTVQVAGEP